VFRTASGWVLTWARCIQSTPPHPISPRSVLRLSSKWSLRFRFSNQNIVSILHLSYACYMPRYLIFLDWVTLIILVKCTSYEALQYNLLQPPATSSLLVRNILLSTLYSHNLNLCSSLSVRDQVSHPYKTTSKLIVLYIIIFKFLEWRREDKRLNRIVGSIPHI
jgi:hypothetical protein